MLPSVSKQYSAPTATFSVLPCGSQVEVELLVEVDDDTEVEEVVELTDVEVVDAVEVVVVVCDVLDDDVELLVELLVVVDVVSQTS